METKKITIEIDELLYYRLLLRAKKEGKDVDKVIISLLESSTNNIFERIINNTNKLTGD